MVFETSQNSTSALYMCVMCLCASTRRGCCFAVLLRVNERGLFGARVLMITTWRGAMQLSTCTLMCDYASSHTHTHTPLARASNTYSHTFICQWHCGSRCTHVSSQNFHPALSTRSHTLTAQRWTGRTPKPETCSEHPPLHSPFYPTTPSEPPHQSLLTQQTTP